VIFFGFECYFSVTYHVPTELLFHSTPYRTYRHAVIPLTDQIMSPGGDSPALRRIGVIVSATDLAPESSGTNHLSASIVAVKRARGEIHCDVGSEAGTEERPTKRANQLHVAPAVLRNGQALNGAPQAAKLNVARASVVLAAHLLARQQQAAMAVVLASHCEQAAWVEAQLLAPVMEELAGRRMSTPTHVRTRVQPVRPRAASAAEPPLRKRGCTSKREDGMTELCAKETFIPRAPKRKNEDDVASTPVRIHPR
jgi:hypothetical protein